MALLPHMALFPHMAEFPHIAELPQHGELPGVTSCPTSRSSGRTRRCPKRSPWTMCRAGFGKREFQIAACPQGVSMSATKYTFPLVVS